MHARSLLLLACLFTLPLHAAFGPPRIDIYSNNVKRGSASAIAFTNAGHVSVTGARALVDVGAGGGGSGNGETNTASNLGSGLNTYDSKSGVDLRFNTFSNAGDGITINSNAGLFTINIDWAKVMSQTNATAMSNAIVALISGSHNNTVLLGITSMHSETEHLDIHSAADDAKLFSWFAETEDLDGYLALFSHRSQTYPIKIHTNGTVELLDASFNRMDVDKLTVLSNTTPFAATAYVKHDLDTQGDRLVLTNSMTGNMVLSLTNIAGTTNHSFHFIFEGEVAGGSERFITNTVNSIGNTIPVLLHNWTNAPQVSPLVWAVPAGTILEGHIDFSFHSGTNRGKAVTNIWKR